MTSSISNLSLQEMAIIMLEYLGNQTPTIIGRDADAFIVTLQKDIELSEKHGGFLDIPDEIPSEYSRAKVAKLLEKKRLAPLIYFMRSIYNSDYSIEKILPKDKNSINLLESRIDNVLSQLSDREKTIIEHYYGFDNCNHLSFEEIGVILGISEQNVRQIHESCKYRFNQPELKEKLKDYFYKTIKEINQEIQINQGKNPENLSG
jgi:RNA polymerase sigma factor (sigma-70 family)